MSAVAEARGSAGLAGRRDRRRVTRVPLVAVVLAAVAVAFFTIPLLGLLWRTPWTGLWGELTSPAALRALRLSLVCSLWATGLSLVLGTPLAWVLARVEFPGRRLVRAVALMPMVLPPVAGGMALLLALGRRGMVGRYLDGWFGIRLPFTTPGAVLAETFVAMPFLVVTAEAAFRSLDRRYEEAARSLGASRLTVFRRVTLPLAAPSLVAGAVLCWARALGEFGATITFAGNFEGVTQTVPLAVFFDLESGALGGAVSLSLLLFAVSVIVMVALRDRWLGGG